MSNWMLFILIFPKAFGKVHPTILLSMLKKLGLSDHPFKFFNSFLINRKLLVRIGTVYSEVEVIVSCVIPQGTHYASVSYFYQ